MSLILSKTENVGIGKSNPNATLDISGSVTITGSINGNTAIKDGFLNVHNSGGGGYNFTVSSEYSYDPFIQMSYGSGLNPLNPGRANFLEVGSENLSLICAGGAQRINLKTLSTTRLQVTPNGNVLIGTTTESIYRLDVSGSARVTNDLSVTGSLNISGSILANSVNIGNNILSTTSITGSLSVQVVPTDTVTISNSDDIISVNGRSGSPKRIKITNPQANSGAHAGFSAVNQGSIEGTLTMYSTYVGSYFGLETAGAGGIRIGASNGPITFYNTGSVETARIDNTGSLSLGFTSSLGHKLNVSGSGRLVNGLYMNNSAGGADVRLVAGSGVYDAFTFAGANYGSSMNVEVSYVNLYTRFSNSYNAFQFAGSLGVANNSLFIFDNTDIPRITLSPTSANITGSLNVTGSTNLIGFLNAGNGRFANTSASYNGGSLLTGNVPNTWFFPLETSVNSRYSILGQGTNTTINLPAIANYGYVGVAGISAGSTGGRTNVGLLGYTYFIQNMSGNSSNRSFGGYLLAKGSGSVTDFVGSYTGIYAEANIGDDTGSSGEILASDFVAVGKAQQTTYGSRITVSGGGINYGVYITADTNYFSGNVSLGKISPNAKLDVNGSAIITGSVTITSALTLTPSNPLPTGTTGSLATSGSALYFHDGTNWRQVQLI